MRLKNNLNARIRTSDHSKTIKYPFHTVSKPVYGSEAEKLAQAIQSGGHIANETALTLMQQIAARRKTENASK
jgi:hypothetical protein